MKSSAEPGVGHGDGSGRREERGGEEDRNSQAILESLLLLLNP